MDKLYYDLTNKNTLIPGIEQLPSERFLGAGAESDNIDDNIRLFIGNKPVLVNIRDFVKMNGGEIPPDLELFKSYEMYVLSHSVGIIKEGGWKKVQQVGYRMEFDNNDQSIVIDILPQAKYTKKLGGELKFEAALALNGSIEPPVEVTKLIEGTRWLSAGGKLQAATSGNVAGNISFSVYSTEIQAIGKNGNYSEWQFNRTDIPLHGHDIEMNQILLVDRFASTISYKCKAYVNISSFMGINSVRRETDWIPVRCDIK